jgi:hypothetical protein
MPPFETSRLSRAKNGRPNHPHNDTKSMKAKNVIDHYAP